MYELFNAYFVTNKKIFFKKILNKQFEEKNELLHVGQQ